MNYITNFFVASALGVGNEETYQNYKAKFAPGMREVSRFIPSRSIYFGFVNEDVEPISPIALNTRTNRLISLALSREKAFKELVDRYGATRVGVVIGGSNTGVHEAQKYCHEWMKAIGEKPDAPPPKEFDFSQLALGTPANFLRDLIGAKGPTYTVSTACSSSIKAFASAARLLESGLCDAVITGGVDGYCSFVTNGFHALGALSEGRCRPLAEDRDGINLGEGVALFTLERKQSENSILLSGIGETTDAYHMTAPDPTGEGAAEAMRMALKASNIKAVDYINLHGTGTLANDAMEMEAVRKVFGEKSPKYESTKNLTGHCLGAAGAVESAICMLLIQNKCARVTLNNSFAFGGSNASIVFSA